MIARSLAERLATVRTRPPDHVTAAATDDARVERLAHWFDARTDVAEGGTVLVVERSIPFAPSACAALASLPDAVYFDAGRGGHSDLQKIIRPTPGVPALSGDKCPQMGPNVAG